MPGMWGAGEDLAPIEMGEIGNAVWESPPLDKPPAVGPFPVLSRGFPAEYHRASQLYLQILVQRDRASHTRLSCTMPAHKHLPLMISPCQFKCCLDPPPSGATCF